VAVKADAEGTGVQGSRRNRFGHSTLTSI